MDDTSQIQPPPSFADLFRTRSGKLSASIGEVVQRYELCEDMATHLSEQAQMIYHSGNSSEEGVLLGIHTAISAEGSALSPAEATWVVLRMAELLTWRSPELPQPSDSQA